MRTDWRGEPTGRNSKRDVSLLIYASTSWPELLGERRIARDWSSFTTYAAGELSHGVNLDEDYYCLVGHRNSDPEDGSVFWRAAVEADYALPAPFDLSPYMTRGSHSTSEMSCSFVYSGTLPRTGSLVVVHDNITDQRLWVGMIENYNSRSVRRGQATYTMTARSRDASPLWRATPWSTDVYPVATELAVIIGDIVTALGLNPEEFPTVQPYSRWTPHTTTQLGDMAAWEMLTVTLQPVLLEPWIDALGRFKPISRDVRRDADLIVERASVISKTGSKSSLPPTAVIVKWLDPILTKSVQQDQVLATDSATCGFFKSKEKRLCFWSKDRAQRAEDTRMKVLSSVNDALLPVGDEEYEQLDPFRGRITITTSAWVPTVATVMVALLLVFAAIPDLVAAFGGGSTISVGRLVHAAAEIVLLLIMMSLGTGSYEIWGKPYDFVHARNTTEAYRGGVRQWERVEVEIQNDFLSNEEHAQGLVVSELLHRSLAASSETSEVCDDPRLERGDIALLDGDTRLYVLDYTRDISRGAVGTLQLQGFRV